MKGAADAIRSGWITTGPKTKEFEKRIAEYVHTNRDVCLNSQTACAEIVLRLLEIGEGDEVIVPAYTYTASASVGIGLDGRQEIIVKMAEAGIATYVHYKPLPMMTAYKNLGFDIKNFPNADKKFENEIPLPLHTKLTGEEVEYVIEKYCEIVEEYGEIKKSTEEI